MQHKSIFTWEAKTREGLINSKSFNWFDSKANTKLNFFTTITTLRGKLVWRGGKENKVSYKREDKRYYQKSPSINPI